jgi:hypothetical protein
VPTVPLLLVEQPLQQRIRSLRTRTRSTFIMISGFTLVLWAGHVVVCLFIVCIQASQSLRLSLCQPVVRSAVLGSGSLPAL